MPSPTRSRRRPATLLAIGVAVLVSACSSGPTVSPGGGAQPTPAGGSGQPSGAAACPAIAAPAADPEGWGPPASAPTVTPLLIASPGELVCGPNRLLFSFVDAANRPVAAPDRSASLAIYELGRDPSKPIATAQGTFIWAIEDERGVYVANVSFPSSGRYGAEFETAVAGGPTETIRLTFDVQPSSAVVKVGDEAPASKTPTLADVDGDVARISTDPHPVPAFYETSVDEALAAHEPFVLIFATPKFCTSAQCGPTLDRIKPFADRYPTVTFINVEPYKLTYENGTLEADLDAQGQLQVAPTTEEWHLFSEPTVYVVDRQGVVQGAFALIFSDDELTAALDEVK